MASSITEGLELAPSMLKSMIDNLDSANPEEYFKNVKSLIGESLFYTFDALVGTPHYKSEMCLGVEGLPDTSAQLVEIGLFEINGKFVELSPVVKQVAIAKKNLLDELLLKLKIKTGQPSSDL